MGKILVMGKLTPFQVTQMRTLIAHQPMPRRIIFQLISILMLLPDNDVKAMHKIYMTNLKKIVQNAKKNIVVVPPVKRKLRKANPQQRKAYTQIKNAIVANNKQPVSFYTLVLDPKSLTTTSDNIALVEWLLNQNLIAIEDGDDGFPYVRILKNAEVRARLKPTQLCKCLREVNKKNCKKFKELYGIEKPLIDVTSVDDNEEGAN